MKAKPTQPKLQTAINPQFTGIKKNTSQSKLMRGVLQKRGKMLFCWGRQQSRRRISNDRAPVEMSIRDALSEDRDVSLWEARERCP